jgi:hypothetical protein
MRAAVITFALAVAFILGSVLMCHPKRNPLYGTWIDQYQESVNFQSNGAAQEGTGGEFRYRILPGSKLMIKAPNGDQICPYKISPDEKTLTITNGAKIRIFHRPSAGIR